METVDLHGFTIEGAKEKLIKSLEWAYLHQVSVVRIIHGQGKHSEVFPVIKSFVRHWLEESEFGRQRVVTVFRGEDGSPYTQPNAGETIIVLKIAGSSRIDYNNSSIIDEEEREARKNSKALRADRLRTARRRSPHFK